jgi:hypothetical protein
MIYTTNGGALMDKTPKAIKQLIPSMAANTQQFGTRIDTPIDMLMR